MTVDQQEVILNKIKEMLKADDVEVIVEERSKVVKTTINNAPIASKGKTKLILIIDHDDTVIYDEEAIAKILAK